MNAFAPNVSASIVGTASVNFTDPNRSIGVGLPSGIDMSLVASAKATVIFKCAVISAIGLFGFFGNVLTLIAILTTPILQTKSNRLIAALCAWELFLQGPLNVCNTTYQILTFVVSDHPCRYRTFVAVVIPIQKTTFYACVMHFLAIALDRYIAIVYPLRYEALVTETRLNYVIGTCSLFAIALGIGEMSWLVNISWSSCDLPYSLLMHFVIDSGMYFGGILVLALVYGRIAHVALQHHRKIGQNPALQIAEPSTGTSVVESSSTAYKPQQIETKTGKPRSSRRGEFKAARMTATVIGSNSICWLPFIIGNGMQLAGIRAEYAQNLVDVGAAFGTAIACLNCVIYGVMSRSFRRAFWRLLCKRCCNVGGRPSMGD